MVDRWIKGAKKNECEKGGYAVQYVWPRQTLNYINSAKITHILIDVKERCHDGILNCSQIWLVPVDVEHSSYIVAAGVVTGYVLQ